jgi:hypothetical protein
MSDASIGDIEYNWELLSRNSKNRKVELWYNSTSGFYGVYLYPNVYQDEDWLAWKETKDRDKAEEISDAIAAMLS